MAAEVKPLAPSAQAAIEAIKLADGTRWLDQAIEKRIWTSEVHRAALANLAEQSVNLEGKFDRAIFRSALASEQWCEHSNFNQNRLQPLAIAAKKARLDSTVL
jgi:hypothetical protein